MKELALPEQFSHLAEEITAIIAQKKFEAGVSLLEMRHEIGAAVIGNPLYRKNAKGQGKLIQELAGEVGLSPGRRLPRVALPKARSVRVFSCIGAGAGVAA